MFCNRLEELRLRWALEWRLNNEWKIIGQFWAIFILYLSGRPLGDPGQLPGEDAEDAGILFTPHEIVFSLHRLQIFFESSPLKIGKSWSAFQFAFLDIDKIKLFCKPTCFQRVRKLLDNCCSLANFLRWSCWMMLLQLICRFSVLSLVRGPGSIYFMILI